MTENHYRLISDREEIRMANWGEKFSRATQAAISKSKEMAGTVSVRRQGGIDVGSMSAEDFVTLVSKEIKDQLS